MADNRRLFVLIGVVPVLLAVLAVLVSALLPDDTSSITANPPGQFRMHDQPRTLPAFSFQGPQGNTLTLEDFRGRVVLLNVWATWCPPCRDEMPSLDRLQATLGPSAVVLPMSVDREGRSVVQSFYASTDIEHLGIYVDPTNEATAALNAFGIPMTLLIDRQGREIGRMMGATEWDTDSMVRFLRNYIEQG